METVKTYLEEEVIKVRNNLAKKYDINTKYFKDYQDLCDIAVKELEDQINKNNKCNIIKITKIHGEMRHHPRIKSSKWIIEHTWMSVTFFNNLTIYIDPTSSQFKDLFSDIPDYYISEKKPKWFLADKDNLRYSNKLFKFLNNHIKYYRKVDNIKVSVGIIKIMQLDIWGYISDIFHNIFFKN